MSYARKFALLYQRVKIAQNNQAEYEVQRRHMMQEWSNIIDAWVAGQKYVPVLIPPSMPLLELDPALSPAESAVA